MRKKTRVTITDEGRDKGKVFELTEMPSLQAEKWAMRAFLAMGRAGVQIPDGVQNLGFVGIGILGLKSLASMHWQDAEPLMDEMFQGVRYVPDPAKPDIVRDIMESADDIEEIKTRLRLRAAVLDLHAGFTFAGKLFDLDLSPKTTTSPASSTTPTSPASSGS